MKYDNFIMKADTLLYASLLQVVLGARYLGHSYTLKYLSRKPDHIRNLHPHNDWLAVLFQ